MDKSKVKIIEPSPLEDIIMFSEDFILHENSIFTYHTLVSLDNKSKTDYLEYSNKLYVTMTVDNFGSAFIGNSVIKSKLS